MKINKNTSLPLDEFIEYALYDKDTGRLSEVDMSDIQVNEDEHGF